MIREIKSVFTLFLLTVFIFPTIVKEIHTTHHEKRFHCEANGEQHLHEAHPDCSLCDFVIPFTSLPSITQQVSFHLNTKIYFFSHFTEAYRCLPYFSLAPLRGPPAFC